MLKLLPHILIGLLTIFCLEAGASEGVIAEKSFFSDESNALSIANIQDKAFTPYYENVYAGGYSKSALWMKLKINPNARDLVLRIRPNYTDEIQLFDPLDGYKPHVTGDKYPWASSDVKTLGLNFKLPASDQSREVYLRFKSAHSYMYYVNAYETDQFFTLDQIETFLYEWHVAFLALIFAWLFITWLFSREKVLGLFVGHQFLSLAHAFLLLGFARILFDQYVAPTKLNEIGYWLILAYMFWVVLSHKFLLKEYGLKRVYEYGFNVLLITPLIAMCILGLGNPLLALKIGALVVLLASILLFLSSVFGLVKVRQDNTIYLVPIKVLRLYYFVILVVWVLIQLTLMNAINAGEFAIHAIYAYSLLNGLLLFGILQYRARGILKQQLARANHHEIQADQERIRRKDQSKLMAMLTHEIKTPLSILKLVLDEKLTGSDVELPANRAVRNIDNIINKCLALDRLDTHSVMVHRSTFVLDDLVSDVLADLPTHKLIKEGDFTINLSTDRDFLYVIIRNLLENAIKYSPSEGAITIACSELLDAYEVSVSNLIGPMGAPESNQVFEKYYRNARATKVSGSGLGLFLVKSLTGLLGGKVIYTSNPDQVIFKVCLPK